MGSQAIGINDHGDINGNYRGLQWRIAWVSCLKGGKLRYAKMWPGATYTLGGGINNAGAWMTESMAGFDF